MRNRSGNLRDSMSQLMVLESVKQLEQRLFFQ
jgi:hypothetical protein